MNNLPVKKSAPLFSIAYRGIVLCLACMTLTWSLASAQEGEGAGDTKTASLQSRIDFGNAYIMGQSIKSGSVYLLHRKKSDIDSMLKIRTDFRDKIIEDFSLEDTQIISQEAEAVKAVDIKTEGDRGPDGFR